MSVDNSNKAFQRGTVAKRVDQVSALLWIAIGIVVIIQSKGLKFTDEYGPGPGFLPLCAGVGFIFLGIMLLVQVTFSLEDKEDISLPSKQAAWQMFLVMFGYFGFVFLGEKLGFLFCIGLLFLFLLIIVERRDWKFSMAISIICTFIFWAVFVIGLQVRLP